MHLLVCFSAAGLALILLCATFWQRWKTQWLQRCLGTREGATLTRRPKPAYNWVDKIIILKIIIIIHSLSFYSQYYYYCNFIFNNNNIILFSVFQPAVVVMQVMHTALVYSTLSRTCSWPTVLGPSPRLGLDVVYLSWSWTCIWTSSWQPSLSAPGDDFLSPESHPSGAAAGGHQQRALRALALASDWNHAIVDVCAWSASFEVCVLCSMTHLSAQQQNGTVRSLSWLHHRHRRWTPKILSLSLNISNVLDWKRGSEQGSRSLCCIVEVERAPNGGFMCIIFIFSWICGFSLTYDVGS